MAMALKCEGRHIIHMGIGEPNFTAAPLENGSEVRMPNSSYPCNRHFIAAFDGRAKIIVSGPIECSQLSHGMVHEHWDEHNRGVLLASPSNSTDTSILHSELARIITTVRGKGGFHRR